MAHNLLGVEYECFSDVDDNELVSCLSQIEGDTQYHRQCITTHKTREEDGLQISEVILNEKNDNESLKKHSFLLSGSTKTEDHNHEKSEEEDSLKMSQVPPMVYRPRYLWVSDLTSQSWCEQQLYYSFTKPFPFVIKETPAMSEGSSLHLARELAAHDIVNVKVTSNEDILAIKVLNLLTGVQGFLEGQILARELPVFGLPFDADVFVVGLIDELRFDPESYSLDLWELKTRQMRRVPSAAQRKQHRLQVALYKELFDNLVKGKLSKTMVSEHLQVELEAELGTGLQDHLRKHFITYKTLDGLLEYTFQRLQALTCISQMFVEYVHQGTNEMVSCEEISYSDEELREKYLDALKFWRGQREARGVEIEEAWKCQSCDFADVCEWRNKKSIEYAQKNFRKTNSLCSP